jgi:hypothetical protein
MDNTAQFVSNLNVPRFEDRLRFEHGPAIRASLQRLLLEEEDKLGCRVERLGNVQRHTSEGSAQFRQRAVFAPLKFACDRSDRWSFPSGACLSFGMIAFVAPPT